MTVEIKFDSWDEFDRSAGSLADIINAIGQANLEQQIKEREAGK